jgi:hypothetical protein
METRKKIAMILLAIFGVSALIFLLYFTYLFFTSDTPTNYDQCVKSQNAKVLKSYPVVCIAENGERFVEEIDESAGEYESVCLVNGGTWLAEYNECEYISQETCEEARGKFDECGSACRHEEEMGPCTLNCVPYCAF